VGSATGDWLEFKDSIERVWFHTRQSSPERASPGGGRSKRMDRRENRVGGGPGTGIYLIDPRNGELPARIRRASKCGWVGCVLRSAFTPAVLKLIVVTTPPP